MTVPQRARHAVCADHSLEPEDMLTLEASALTGVPLGGVDKVFKLD